MKACFLIENYIKSLENTQKSDFVTHSVRLILRCVNEIMPDADVDFLNADFFRFFFEKWLSYELCQEDDSIILNSYPQVMAFCQQTDLILGTELLRELSEVENVDEIMRILLLKKSVLNFIKSPIISKNPSIINLERYRKKQQLEKKLNNTMLPEKGMYAVADIFTNNSIVLKKISGYTSFIRIYLNDDVIKKICPGDILDLKVRKSEELKGWIIEDIYGCFAREENEKHK